MGDPITGLDTAGAVEGVIVFHAGTALSDGNVIVNDEPVPADEPGYMELRGLQWCALAMVACPANSRPLSVVKV